MANSAIPHTPHLYGASEADLKITAEASTGYYWSHVLWLPCLTIILSYFYINILMEIRRMKIRFPLLALKLSPSAANDYNRYRPESS
jgi:hypothetical protein